MRKEGMNRWPDREDDPDLWTHDLRRLFNRIGINPATFDPSNPIAPALKMCLDWRRDHGYSIGKVPQKYAADICEAGFGPNGIVEWLAGLYRLNI